MRESQMKREWKGEERQTEKSNKIVFLLNVARRVTHYMQQGYFTSLKTCINLPRPMHIVLVGFSQIFTEMLNW